MRLRPLIRSSSTNCIFGSSRVIHPNGQTHMRFTVLRLLIRALSLTTLTCIVLYGQDNLPDDSTNSDRSPGVRRMELGINSLGAGVEYRYQLQSFLSMDAMVSIQRPGVAIGATVSLLSFFILQGMFGNGAFEDAQATDGPPAFKPNYLYGWKAGIQFPIAPRKTDLYILFAAGQLKYVQSHYQYNGGGMILGPPPVPRYRRETRVAEVFAVSLGIRF